MVFLVGNKKELETEFAKVVKCDGGYACFDNESDYIMWKNQK